MTVPADRPPAAVEDTRSHAHARADAENPAARPTTTEKLGIEDHTVLLIAVVAACVLLAFGAMIVLTALGGGSDYVPWSD